MFSQQDEEGHILASTPEIGKFLDIGAWHPEDLSNSRALFLRGWSGVVIDPAPAAIHALLDVYGHEPRVVICAAMVGIDRCMREIHISDGPYSTAHQDTADRFADLAQFRGDVLVQQIPIDEVLNRWGPFHFINIDIEGGSVDLFRALMDSAMKPPCVCVEHDGRVIEAVKIAQAAGYRLIHGNDTNLIFGQ